MALSTIDEPLGQLTEITDVVGYHHAALISSDLEDLNISASTQI